MSNFSTGIIVGSGVLCAAFVAALEWRRRRLRVSQFGKTHLFVLLDVLTTSAAAACVAGTLAASIAGPGGTGFTGLIEAGVGLGIFAYLWSEGRHAHQFQRPDGIVLGEFLVLAAFARLAMNLVEHKRPVADLWSAGGIVAGGILLAVIVPRFLKGREEHRIIERVTRQGEVAQPEYTPPTPECPHPERWTMVDSMSAETEILQFLKQLVMTLKPELVVETGTFIGLSALQMAEGLRENGFGKLITCEFDPLVYAKAKEKIEASGLRAWIEGRNQSSLEMEIEGAIDLFFSDSHLPIREQEIRRFLPQIRPNGLILMHDTSSHYKVAREGAFRLEHEGLISMVLLPTPRGLMMAQKREGRK